MKGQKKKQNGITLIALVISIIVMLILAGVSLNMTVGDNGIIRQAQNASYEMGMAALEEWLQQEYVTQYDNITDSDEGNKIAFLNRMFNYTLLLKDGSRDYIINEGKVYYLLNKSCKAIPKEVRDGLLGGDTTEYSKYTRLEDVYGITKDLKVYYCGVGIEGALGAIENYDIDPNASATGINGNSNMKTALTDILSSQYGIIVDSEKGVTLANASVLKNLELDGTKYSGITDVSALGDLKNLKTLTLSNLTLNSLSGLEGIPGLYYVYLKNTTVGDYTALSSCINLQYLYLYLPSTINQTTANNQVLYLGQGLKDASGLTKLQYFGISGDTVMYNDSIIKNMDHPSTSNNTNKLMWTSTAYSNVTSLGENTGTTKTGLYAFNDTVKNSIQYMYLNNNNFSNVNALSGFSAIVELQLMCNPSLSNIDGLSNHTKLEGVTLHNCALTSLGSYDATSHEYVGGLSGCNALTKLSVQRNSGLTSLIGIDGATNMIYLVASNCALTNIDSLANHSKIQYLNLSSNTSLVSVKYIQHCKALNYIYLDNNTNMATTEVDSALNGSDNTANTLGTDALIKKCINGYSNIPKSYWDLFTSTATVLDWSYSTLGEYLYVNSAKWVKLRGRTDVTKLKLDGQTQLKMEDSTISGVQYYGIDSTLKTLTGMKALSLKGCTQVDSISFIEPKYTNTTTKTLTSGMPSLAEINLCSISTTLTNYSSLNSCTNMKSLIINNSNVNLTNLVTTLKRLSSTTDDKSWAQGSYGKLTLCSYGPWVFHDESATNKLTVFNYNWTCPLYSGEVYVNLSDTSCTEISGYAYDGAKTTFVLPSTISSIKADCCRNSVIDMSTITSGTHITTFNYGHNSDGYLKTTLASSRNVIIDFLHLWCTPYVSSDDLYFGSVKWLDIWYEQASGNLTWNLKTFGTNTFTERISLGANHTNKGAKLSNLTEFGKNRTIKDIKFENVNISDISWLSGMTQVKCLELPYNNISNISALANLENIDMKRIVDGVTTQYNYNLSNNIITDLTPLVTAIGTDNKIGYSALDVRYNSLDGYSVADNITALLKLHAAGLTKVYITGNNFSANEVNELINGKTVTNSDGSKTTYAGFGSANVVN